MNIKRMRGRNNRGGGGGSFRSYQGGTPLNRNHVFDSNGPNSGSAAPPSSFMTSISNSAATLRAPATGFSPKAISSMLSIIFALFQP